MPVTEGVYGLLAEFADADALVAACRRAREVGYTRLDAFAPYPLSEAADALGRRRTAVPAVVLVGGLVGCAAGFLMQLWCMAVDYPINVGGRPLNSWPAFIPVTFEMTILTAAMAALFGLMALCRLPHLYHPVFNEPRFLAASRDGFFLCVEADDPRFDPVETARFLNELNPAAVAEVPR